MERVSGEVPTLTVETSVPKESLDGFSPPEGPPSGLPQTDPVIGPLTEPNESADRSGVLVLNDAQLLDSRLLIEDHEGFESLGIIRRQVLNQLAVRGWRRLGVVSPLTGDGKTSFAINLALSVAADMGHCCVLVDADLRSPSVAEYLNIDVPVGLDDCLLEGLPVEHAMLEVADRNLSVLPCREAVPRSAEWMASRTMTEIVEQLLNLAGDPILLFDLPPILSGDDALGFLKNIDAVVIVVADGQTSKTSVKRLSHLLGSIPVVGVVLNKAHVDPYRDHQRYG